MHCFLARQPVARNMRPGFDIAYDVLRERERALGFPGIIDLRLHLWESLLRLNLISVYRMIVQHQSMKFAARPNRATILISFIDHKIGRASCRERVVSTCRSRWSPYH